MGLVLVMCILYCFSYVVVNWCCLQPNAETEDNITPLLSAVAAGSLTCLDLLIQVSYLH